MTNAQVTNEASPSPPLRAQRVVAGYSCRPQIVALVIATFSLFACAVLPISADTTLGVEYRNMQLLDTAGHSGAAITGLSGVTYLGQFAGQHRFIAVQDNSNQFVTFDATFNADGSIAANTYIAALMLSATRDYEGIAYTDATRNSVFVSSEGPAAIHEHSLANGSLLQTVTMPAAYSNALSNFGLEALTRSPDGSAMWTANEEALTTDGGRSTTSAGTTVRLQRFTITGNTPGSAVADANHYTYTTEPIHAAVNGDSQNLSRSGLVDLVSLPNGTLLALERSFAADGFATSYQSRIYEIELNPDFTTTKHLLWSANSSFLGGFGNLEGLTLGPQLDNGNYILLGIVDDGGDSDVISQNTLVAFELTGSIPEPGSAGMGVVSVLMLGCARGPRGRGE